MRGQVDWWGPYPETSCETYIESGPCRVEHGFWYLPGLVAQWCVMVAALVAVAAIVWIGIRYLRAGVRAL